MAWVVQRYITLAGGGTLFDPDPSVAQPGDVALDGAGQPIPLTVSKGGIVWGDVIVVDDAGVPRPVGAEKFDLAFVKKTASGFVPAIGTKPVSQTVWNKGSISTQQDPGFEQAQAQMESPATAALCVLGGAGVPADGRLAVRVWSDA